MGRVVGIFTALTFILLVITILSSTISCAPEPENVFMELLGLLPAEASEVPIIAIVNYKKIFEDNAISIYDGEGNRISVDEFSDILCEKSCNGQLSGESAIPFRDSFYTGVNSYMLAGQITKENVGYDVLDSEAEINFHMNIYPSYKDNGFSEYLVAAKGKFDARATKEALKNQEEWPPWAIELYKTEVYNDVIIHSWGDGSEEHFSSILEAPHLNDLGQARPLAIYDGYLFVAESVADIKQLIDACKNTSGSLADISDYALATRSIFDMDVYDMILINPVLLDPELPNSGVFYTGFGLKDSILVASGQGEDEEGKYVAVAYVQEDEDNSTRNKSILISYLYDPINRLNWDTGGLFEWRFSDHIIEKEIRTEGRVLTAKIYLDDEGFNWWWSPLLVKM